VKSCCCRTIVMVGWDGLRDVGAHNGS
jgi:hypothetical protein